MNKKFPLSTYLISATALLLVNAVATADIAEVTMQDDNTATFEYQDDNLRLTMPGQQGYMVVRDERTYVVTENNGQFMVFDVNQAVNMFGDMTKSSTPAILDSEVISLEPTGKQETLAGIEGEVYLLEFVDHAGKRDQAEIVLSSDPLAIKFRDVVSSMANSLAASSTQDVGTAEALQQRLVKLDKGVLRYGKDFQVRSLRQSKIDPARFELPAEPTDLSAIGRMMQQGGADGEGTGENPLHKAFEQLLGK